MGVDEDLEIIPASGSDVSNASKKLGGMPRHKASKKKKACFVAFVVIAVCAASLAAVFGAASKRNNSSEVTASAANHVDEEGPTDPDNPSPEELECEETEEDPEAEEPEQPPPPATPISSKSSKSAAAATNERGRRRRALRKGLAVMPAANKAAVVVKDKVKDPSAKTKSSYYAQRFLQSKCSKASRPTGKSTTSKSSKATLSPTVSPTKSPSISPTSSPTASPTESPTPADCSNVPSVRKDWRDMTCAEQDAFTDAVTQLKASGVYDDFVRSHAALRLGRPGAIIHFTADFLPWHRWYIYVFERELQRVANSCDMFLPYWSWERDAGEPARQNQTPVLSRDGLGSFQGTEADDCTNDGIVNFRTTPFGITVRGTVQGWQPPCLRRAFNQVDSMGRPLGFATEARVQEIITNLDQYADFRPAWENAPHGTPHIWVGGNMARGESPDDPLFFLHHANVDRLWALHQDFLGHDELALDPASFTVPEFWENESAGLEQPMFFDCLYVENGVENERPCDNLDFSLNRDGGALPTPWQAMSNDSQFLRVTQANDFLARQLEATAVGNADWNNPTWFEIATDDVPVRCERDASPIVDIPSSAPTPELAGSCPDIPFTDPALSSLWRELCQEYPGEEVSVLLSRLAKEDCEQRGNPPAATEEWISFTGQPPEWFECYVPLPLEPPLE